MNPPRLAYANGSKYRLAIVSDDTEAVGGVAAAVARSSPSGISSGWDGVAESESGSVDTAVTGRSTAGCTVTDEAAVGALPVCSKLVLVARERSKMLRQRRYNRDWMPLRSFEGADAR